MGKARPPRGIGPTKAEEAASWRAQKERLARFDPAVRDDSITQATGYGESPRVAKLGKAYLGRLHPDGRAWTPRRLHSKVIVSLAPWDCCVCHQHMPTGTLIRQVDGEDGAFYHHLQEQCGEQETP